MKMLRYQLPFKPGSIITYGSIMFPTFTSVLKSFLLICILLLTASVPVLEL
jgi:hypothetical protein